MSYFIDYGPHRIRITADNASQSLVAQPTCPYIPYQCVWPDCDYPASPCNQPRSFDIQEKR